MTPMTTTPRTRSTLSLSLLALTAVLISCGDDFNPDADACKQEGTLLSNSTEGGTRLITITDAI